MRTTKLTAAERLANRRRTNARAQAAWRRRRDDEEREWKNKLAIAVKYLTEAMAEIARLRAEKEEQP
jgi:hypothetical protein